MWSIRRAKKTSENPVGQPESDVHTFSADRPIRDSRGDRLNRKGFAAALAGAIGSWHGQDSLVVGLYGPWGVGKTSIVSCPPLAWPTSRANWAMFCVWKDSAR